MLHKHAPHADPSQRSFLSSSSSVSPLPCALFSLPNLNSSFNEGWGIGISTSSAVWEMQRSRQPSCGVVTTPGVRKIMPLYHTSSCDATKYIVINMSKNLYILSHHKGSCSRAMLHSHTGLVATSKSSHLCIHYISKNASLFTQV